MLAVERDVKPRNMNFAMVDRRATNKEGVLIRINTVIVNFNYIISEVVLFSSK